MVKLRELLSTLSPELSVNRDWETADYPALESEVTGLSTNSKHCQPGDLFIGMPGTKVDGGDFWEQALKAGAVAALVSTQVKGPSDGSACVIPMTKMTQACAEVATQFYDQPSQKLKMVGVTGTNGKTTTTHLVEYLLEDEKATALFGTLYARWPGYEKTATHTTPFAVDLQQQLADAQAAGSEVGIMEVSSHALDQQRVLGCKFAIALFTNLTQDHLDYHNSLDEYFAAKALLFSPTYLVGRAVLNLDDPYGQKLIAQVNAEQVWTYSIDNPSADLYTSELTYAPGGVQGNLLTPQGTIAFHSPLVGQFNVANVLAAVGACLELGLSLDTIAQRLAKFGGVPGRMQQISVSPDQDISVIVDYAHTPDSRENMLKAARPFVQGQMICVFGCGGDRDRTKRPKMGAIAARLADQVVVTSDNPRTEDPQQILQDVLAGIDAAVNPTVEADRRAAIQAAILGAKPGDAVLIAGKGHEDYQILGTEKIHFDDREEAQAALKQRA